MYFYHSFDRGNVRGWKQLKWALQWLSLNEDADKSYIAIVPSSQQRLHKFTVSAETGLPKTLLGPG